MLILNHLTPLSFMHFHSSMYYWDTASCQWWWQLLQTIWKTGGVCEWHLGHHLWWFLGQQRCQCSVQTAGILSIWYDYTTDSSPLMMLELKPIASFVYVSAMASIYTIALLGKPPILKSSYTWSEHKLQQNRYLNLYLSMNTVYVWHLAVAWELITFMLPLTTCTNCLFLHITAALQDLKLCTERTLRVCGQSISMIWTVLAVRRVCGSVLTIGLRDTLVTTGEMPLWCAMVIKVMQQRVYTPTMQIKGLMWCSIDVVGDGN